MGALSPEGLMRVTPLENFVDALSPDRLVRESTHIKSSVTLTNPSGEVDFTKEFCGHSLTR